MALSDLYCPKRTTFRSIFLFITVIVLDVIVFVVTWHYEPLHMATGSYFLDIGVPSILLIATAGSIVKLSHMLIRKSRITEISSSIQYFDKTIQRLDFRMRCDEVNQWLTGLVAGFFIATLLLSIATGIFGNMVFNKIGTILLVAFIDISNIPYIVFLILFMACELSVWCRLKLLCTLVKNGLSFTASRARKDIVMLHHLVAGLTDLHNVLSAIVQHINALFLVQVFMCLAAYTSLLIFTLFSYYRAAVVLGETEYNFARLTVAWSIYNSLFVLPTILFGAWARIEANRFSKLVHLMLRTSNDNLLQDQLLALSLQLHHRPLGIRTCFVPLNWPAYASMIGYISTYVVILIQFDSKAMEISKLSQ
ncbi:uncharacterized protein LOC131288948 [Anopheles ziemanni]|uniref:uncharacterized protein LOC131259965 n=1 Tax=Anopheles coustani TaxID=139045 RepID=UPI002657F476|nr:uncharacterized protein LOC131259965 [Anopheles coustani]XP_058174113.1 uncharacterized protein LOC131288948 [Anopheles ziemanni]